MTDPPSGEAAPGPAQSSGRTLPEAPAPTRTNWDDGRIFAPGTRIAGRYRIVDLLGVGGMGMVYRAVDEQLQIEVALKTVRPEWAGDVKVLERFKGELVLARQVTHRNVVRIHDIGEHEGILFISMDFIPGRSLRQILEHEGALETGRALDLFRQLAAGVGEAHHKGVLHRDLKPGNVLVDGEGRAYLTDFGVARSLGTSGMTRAGSVVGTPDYLSPEQARGEPVDARSDIFALGILLFEMLSGQLPYPGGTYAETLAQRISGKPRSLKEVGVEVPRRIQAVVSKCLEANPKRRYRKVQDLLDDLDRPHPRRTRVVTWSLAALACLLAVGIGFRILPYKAWAFPWSKQAGRKTTVAILPFVDESSRPDLAWMASGIPEMVADSLRGTPSLGVTDSARVFRTLDDLHLKAGSLDAHSMRQLGDLLGADRLVFGRIRTFEGRLRVDAGLATPGLGNGSGPTMHLEASGSEDLPALISRLSEQLRAGLAVTAPPSAGPPLAVPGPALQSYASGVEFLRRGDSLHAAPLLERAVESAPAFTAAWLRLTEAYQDQGLDDRALEAAKRAVATLGAQTGPIAQETRAREALLRGDPAGAERVLQELVRTYPNDLEGRMALANVMAEGGNPAGAAVALQAVVKADPNHPRAWFLLGKYSIQAGDPRRAVEDYLVHALVIQTQLRNKQGQGEVLNASGVAYQEMGELDLALDSYGKAAGLRQEIGDARGRAISLKNLATVYMIRGDYARSQSHLREALAILEGLGDKAGMAELYNAFGGLEEERGRYPEALAHYRSAFQLWRALGDQRSLARSYNNVGYAYYLLSDFENAMVYFQQALRLHRASGDKAGAMLVTQSIGLVQLAQGPWEEAVKSFLEALNESREQDAKSAQAVSLGYLGLAAQYQGRYTAALASYDEALQLLAQLKDKRGQAEFTFLKAGALSELGMLDEGEGALSGAQKLLGGAMNPEQKAALSTLQGELRLRRGALPEARAAFAEARKEAEASHGLDRVLRARLGLGWTALAAGDPKAAVGELQAVQKEAERIGHLPLRLRSLEGLAQAELAKGDLPSAESHLRQALRILQTTGAYAGAYRIHLLLAEAQDRRGAKAEAKASFARAKALCDGLRASLAPAQQSRFDRIPEVRKLAQGSAASATTEVFPHE